MNNTEERCLYIFLRRAKHELSEALIGLEDMESARRINGVLEEIEILKENLNLEKAFRRIES